MPAACIPTVPSAALPGDSSDCDCFSSGIDIVIIACARTHVHGVGWKSTHGSDDWNVHGRFAGAARPSGGMAFSQEPTGFRLQNGHEISDTDHCLTLVTLLRG